MARNAVRVTFEGPDQRRIPDALTSGTALLADLHQRGIVAEMGRRLRIRRQGGYAALDVVLLLFVYFSTARRFGVRALWDLLLPYVRRVAAVAGRRRLPSPASLSRALDAVETKLLREDAHWLLTGVSEIDDVLRHPAVQARDANGRRWHVFDVDPTVTTLRHRALPLDDDLPEPRRRSEDTAAPGHSGRKRGDMQFRRVTAQHSGSSAWVHAHLSTGNGEGVVDFERALDSVVETCRRLEHPLERTLVRMDGEYGNVPSFAACRERSLPFITRLNRPKLYEDPWFLSRLRSAVWFRVPDSLSGPRRSAAEIGTLTITPGRRTRRPDGTNYAPVTLRVIACIFETTGEATHGRVIDGYQVELFAADVPADYWPAPDVVAAYFGRAAQENRFAQEDREFGLDRIISYHLPGQELASLVGLSLWNLQVARGFKGALPPSHPPEQPLRSAPVDDTIPAIWPRDPVVSGLLKQLDWPLLLARRPEWLFDTTTAELTCTDHRPLTFTTVRPAELSPGHTGIIFRRPAGGCEDCGQRDGCLRSAHAYTPKHAEFSVPTAIAQQLRERLDLIRRPAVGPATSGPPEDPPGAHAAAEALFLPARARQIYRRVFDGATLFVALDDPGPEPQMPRLVAADVGDRQRRRKTWAQNVERFALPGRVGVRLHVAGSDALRRMLGESRPSASDAAPTP